MLIGIYILDQIGIYFYFLYITSFEQKTEEVRYEDLFTNSNLKL